MKECDDCGEEAIRRKRCWHCGMFVCRYCWHHIHRCEPDHSKSECKDLKILRAIERTGGRLAARQHLDRRRSEEMANQ